VVTRVELRWDPENREEPPRYEIVLKRLFGPESLTLLVRHSESFMRWSLETRARLATQEQEVLRTLFLLQEGLGKMERELGTSSFDSILLQRLRTLGPPRTLALLSDYEKSPMPESAMRERAMSALNELLDRLARDLNTLGHTEDEIAGVLDGALERYVDERFRLRLRRSLLGR
jgi:hypothetical protein